MSKYSPRTSAPKHDNKYYVNYKSGGYNVAIPIQPDGFCLANCVGYAQGRYREICEDKNIWSNVGTYLSGNAESFWSNARAHGFKTGQTPKLGSIAIYDGPGSDAGHVAVVEQINLTKDGTDIESIVTSNSAYNGTEFYLYTTSKKDGYTDGKRSLLGFIYQNIEFENEPKPVAKTVYRVQIGAFLLKSNAKKMAAEARKKDLQVLGKYYKPYYKVQVGAYYIQANAENMLKTCRELGYKDAFITTEDGKDVSL